MSVQLNSRQVGDVSVIDVSGKVTLGDGASTLRNAIREAAGKGQKKVLLNLAEMSHIDSSGIGELVSGFATIANKGGKLKLVNVTSGVKNLLLITKLYTVFEVFEDESVALRSFADA